MVIFQLGSEIRGSSDCKLASRHGLYTSENKTVSAGVSVRVHAHHAHRVKKTHAIGSRNFSYTSMSFFMVCMASLLLTSQMPGTHMQTCATCLTNLCWQKRSYWVTKLLDPNGRKRKRKKTTVALHEQGRTSGELCDLRGMAVICPRIRYGVIPVSFLDHGWAGGPRRLFNHVLETGSCHCPSPCQ